MMVMLLTMAYVLLRLKNAVYRVFSYGVVTWVEVEDRQPGYFDFE